MLMQPSRSLATGSYVPITLRFAGGGQLTVQFEVRK
jgi:copper(I)-binding protein